MSYRIRARNRADEEVRKVALGRLVKAMQAVSAPAEEQAEGVHQARKRFKELRALLRLVRTPLGKRFAQENRRIRDVGRDLAELRDVTAMLESWDALAEHYGQPFSAGPMQQVRQRLQARADNAMTGGEAGDTAARIPQVIAELERTVGEVEGWSLSGKGFGLFAEGLARTYGDGRAELDLVRRDPSDEQLHEWRKRVKDLWYQTRLLMDAWPAVLRTQCKLLKRLADALGDDHDLAMMQQLMNQEPELFGSEETRGQLQRYLRVRREQLQGDALALGGRVYAESPKALVKRWQRYWTIARREASEAD
ncbi:CHAD domain-containing protein [Stutzerimonas nosocomialis]|uniref:CHAD domain-containing protein n=1 Tax=Stutzerimonas nosocomialis TaxID=1056496 RepID=A0A5R9QWW5_9GAMM|nr:CHAD domain-containing protein [Stutzerimonas nosocomialis]TLX63575.1 CHAD domain-containing protein [Stutzerimonas nosocomialis]